MVDRGREGGRDEVESPGAEWDGVGWRCVVGGYGEKRGWWSGRVYLEPLFPFSTPLPLFPFSTPRAQKKGLIGLCGVGGYVEDLRTDAGIN